MTTRDDTVLSHRVVPMGAGAATGRLRASSADVLIVVLDGEAEVSVERRPARVLARTEEVVVVRGDSWSVRALLDGTRILVVAHPAGVERVVAGLCSDPPLPPHSRLALALEEGVELLV